MTHTTHITAADLPLFKKFKHTARSRRGKRKNKMFTASPLGQPVGAPHSTATHSLHRLLHTAALPHGCR